MLDENKELETKQKRILVIEMFKLAFELVVEKITELMSKLASPNEVAPDGLPTSDEDDYIDDGGPDDSFEWGDEDDSLDESEFELMEIGGSTEKAKKYFKTEGGKKFYAESYLYIGDSTKPSTWKLRIADMSGNITVAQLGRAAAAFSAGGFRGNKVQLPSGEVAKIKRKLRAQYSKLGVKIEDVPESIKEIGTGMLIWKSADGQYRWFTTYSNNYRDEDYPVPEIISAESHKRFVELVDKGKAPYPELWHWHVRHSQYGQADWVAFDADTGFAMASGYILPGHEIEAESLMERKDVLVSHGMPITTVKRDEKDSTIIKEHVTLEISDLPAWAAANKLTNFYMFKEQEMAIPDEKKQYLKELGLSDEQIANIETGNAMSAKKAKDEGLEFKEKPVEPAPESAPAQPQYVPKEEMAEVIALVASQLKEAIAEAVKPLQEKLDALDAKSKELDQKTSDMEDKQMTPSASLASMVARSLSVIGAKETQVRKDSKLTEGPTQAPAEDTATPLSLGSLVRRSVIGV